MLKKRVISFTKEKLDSFIEDVNSCVRINNTTYSLALYPYHLSNVSESVKRLLNTRVGRYDQRLDGILLGYKNLKLITPYASLRADSCYIHVDIQGEFYMFKPKVGATLTGSVNRISSNHIGCLVHKFFNVSVPNKNEDESWPGFHVQNKNIVELTVTEIDLDARLPYIQASIVSCKTPEKKKKKLRTSDVVDNNNELLTSQEATPNSSAKKQKKKQLSQTETNEETSNLNESPKKQKKKRLSQNENGVQTTEETPKLNESAKKQKKKHHSEQPENNNVTSTEDSTKKQKKKKRLSGNTNDLDIKVEELSQNTLILDESQKKQQTPDTNKVNTKKQKIQIPSESQRTNESDYFATPKIKKKQKQQPDASKEEPTEEILEKGSLEDFMPKEKKNKKRNSNKAQQSTDAKSDSAKKKNKKQNDEINIEELQNSLLMEQLESLKEPKKEKKRKSKETQKSDAKPVNLSPIKPMADLEDRKIKKRRQSLSQNVNWENKELKLYDSDLEKTLNTPSETKNILEKSLQFNLAKIEALNANTPRKLKRKHKHENDDAYIQIGKKSKISNE